MSNIQKSHNLTINLTDISSVFAESKFNQDKLLSFTNFLKELEIYNFEGLLTNNKILGSLGYKKNIKLKKSPLTILLTSDLDKTFDLINYSNDKYSLKSLIEIGQIVLHIQPSDSFYDLKNLIKLLNLSDLINEEQIQLLAYQVNYSKVLEYTQKFKFNKLTIVDGKFQETDWLDGLDKLLLIHSESNLHTPIHLVKNLISKNNQVKLVEYNADSIQFNKIKNKIFREIDQQKFVARAVLRDCS